MKIKTTELTDATLDWAAAKCEGLLDQWGVCAPAGFRPSSNWAQGGPIIERQGISVVFAGDASDWVASIYNYKTDDWYLHTDGSTPLIAAMRCYVASKLGDEVEVPEELT